MPTLSLNEAAKAAKRSKTQILKDLSNGRLSGSKNEVGHWQIEAGELFRVYPQNQAVTSNQNHNDTPAENQPVTTETTALKEQIILLGQERDRERSQLISVIDDLRKRLDKADDERTRLTALLTHQSQTKPPENRSTGARMALLVILLVLVSVGAVLALRLGLVS